MPRFSARLGAVALLMFASSCDSTEDAFSRVDLQTDQELEYTTRSELDDLLDDGGPMTVTGRLVQRVTSRDAQLETLRGLSVVEVELVEDDRPDVTYGLRSWYRPTDARLEEVAYQFFGAGLGWPRNLRAATRRLTAAAPLGEARLGGDLACPLGCPTVIYETPHTVIEYPADAGRTWTRVDSGDFRSTREVLRAETITTPAGTFSCIVVRSVGTSSFSRFESTEWIASVGLVRHESVSRTSGFLPDGTEAESVFSARTELVSVRR